MCHVEQLLWVMTVIAPSTRFNHTLKHNSVSVLHLLGPSSTISPICLSVCQKSEKKKVKFRFPFTFWCHFLLYSQHFKYILWLCFQSVILTVRTAEQCLHVWLWVIPMTIVVCYYSEDDIISREPIRFLIMSQWSVSILNDRDWLWFYYLALSGNQRTYQHCCRQTNHPAMSLFNKEYLFSSLWSYFVFILFSFKQWSTAAWHTGDAD